MATWRVLLREHHAVYAFCAELELDRERLRALKRDYLLCTFFQIASDLVVFPVAS